MSWVLPWPRERLRSWWKRHDCSCTRKGGNVQGVREGLSQCTASGARFYYPHKLGILADVLLGADEPQAASEVLDEALRLIERYDERYFLSEILRLKGHATLALNELDTRSVEVCYTNALEVAKGERARLFSLRAAVSLSRLWAGQDRGADADKLLTPIHASFTEGFDTPDLKEAKVLLDQLG